MRFWMLLALLIIAGCSTAPPATPPSAVPPTAVPPTALPPAPTNAPVGSLASVTPADPPAPLLPAPLYVLERGQIARIERDGSTRNQVTRERIEIEGFLPISNFAVGADNQLAYVVGDLSADRLMRADARGEDSRVIYSEQGHELSHLVWSNDGTTLFLRLLNNKEPPDMPSGVYRMPAEGDELSLIQADDPVDDPINPAPTLRGYRPVALNPAGDTLLVEAFSLFYEGCDYALLAVAGGEPQLILPPEGLQTYCGEAGFAADGSVVLMIGPPIDARNGPTIWQAQANGNAAPVAVDRPLGRAPAALADGRVAFVQVGFPSDTNDIVTFQPALLPGPQPIAAPFSDQLVRALWAPDGSGLIAHVQPPNDAYLLRWIPAGGEAVVLPSSREAIDELAWGTPE